MLRRPSSSGMRANTIRTRYGAAIMRMVTPSTAIIHWTRMAVSSSTSTEYITGFRLTWCSTARTRRDMQYGGTSSKPTEFTKTTALRLAQADEMDSYSKPARIMSIESSNQGASGALDDDETS